MDPELVKLLAGGDTIYLVHNHDLYLKLQPALGGYYEEELSRREYDQLKENFTVKKRIPLGLFDNSTKLKDSIRRQLGLEDF
jgi:hypothetical protein